MCVQDEICLCHECKFLNNVSMNKCFFKSESDENFIFRLYLKGGCVDFDIINFTCTS